MQCFDLNRSTDIILYIPAFELAVNNTRRIHSDKFSTFISAIWWSGSHTMKKLNLIAFANLVSHIYAKITTEDGEMWDGRTVTLVVWKWMREHPCGPAPLQSTCNERVQQSMLCALLGALPLHFLTTPRRSAPRLLRKKYPTRTCIVTIKHRRQKRVLSKARNSLILNKKQKNTVWNK